MSVSVVYVEPEHREILRQYLSQSSDCVALVFDDDARHALESQNIQSGDEVTAELNHIGISVAMVESEYHPVVTEAHCEK